MLVLSKKVVTSLVKSTESDKRGCLSTLTLLILKLSKVSFSDILRNDYLDHFDTFGENFDFDTFKNDTFENDTFESVWVDRHPLCRDSRECSYTHFSKKATKLMQDPLG